MLANACSSTSYYPDDCLLPPLPPAVALTPLCSCRATKALKRRESDDATSGITAAAAKKMEAARRRSLRCVGDVNFTSVTADKVIATLRLTQHVAVTVVLRRECAAGERPVSCSCRKPMDRGMPCKHALVVFRGLRNPAHTAEARRFRALDPRWFDKVWHTATWCEQYATPFPPMEVRKHAVLCILACADTFCCLFPRRLRRRGAAHW